MLKELGARTRQLNPLAGKVLFRLVLVRGVDDGLGHDVPQLAHAAQSLVTHSEARLETRPRRPGR